MFDIIVAYDHGSGGIGSNGGLPWRLPSELKRFKSMTFGHSVIMGRNTWDSLPGGKGLAGRYNIVITRNPASLKLVAGGICPIVVTTFDDALKEAKAQDDSNIFVIGGETVYREAMAMKECKRIYATELYLPERTDIVFDAFFPTDALSVMYRCVSNSQAMVENGISYVYRTYEKFD